MKFGQTLTYYREREKFNKRQLALKLGVKAPYISGIEKGYYNPPTPERLEELCKILRLNDKEKKALFELAYEERKKPSDALFQEVIGPKTHKALEVKPVKIPVVTLAKGDDKTGFEFEPIEPHDYEYLDFNNCKAVRIRGNSMAPLAYDNQRVIYSEEEVVRDGDLVFISLKKKGQFFKRYHKDAKNGIITLLSINIAHHGPINAKTEDIEFMYRVVGVKF